MDLISSTQRLWSHLRIHAYQVPLLKNTGTDKHLQMWEDNLSIVLYFLNLYSTEISYKLVQLNIYGTKKQAL